MYGTHDGNFVDDAKSYSTYEKGLDDDFAKHYEDDDNDLDEVKPSTTTYLTDEPMPVLNIPTTNPNPNQPWSKMEGKPRNLHHSLTKLLI